MKRVRMMCLREAEPWAVPNGGREQSEERRERNWRAREKRSGQRAKRADKGGREASGEREDTS